MTSRLTRRQGREALPELRDGPVISTSRAIPLEALLDRIEQLLIAERLVRNSMAPAFIARTLMVCRRGR